MLKIIKEFFDFCNEKNRRKFHVSIVLGILDALLGAMRIPAAYFAMEAAITKHVTANTFYIVMGLMLISTLGKMVINRFSNMLQTEAGYDTCAGKRIEIGEHLRYLPMGYFNDTSLGHITSVTTNMLEQTGDVATRAIMIVTKGVIATLVIGIALFAFDVRIGLIALGGAFLFFLCNLWTNRSVVKISDEKLASDKDMVGVILEFIQGIAEIRNYNIIAQNNTRLSNAIERKTKVDIQAEVRPH